MANRLAKEPHTNTHLSLWTVTTVALFFMLHGERRSNWPLRHGHVHRAESIR